MTSVASRYQWFQRFLVRFTFRTTASAALLIPRKLPWPGEKNRLRRLVILWISLTMVRVFGLRRLIISICELLVMSEMCSEQSGWRFEQGLVVRPWFPSTAGRTPAILCPKMSCIRTVANDQQMKVMRQTCVLRVYLRFLPWEYPRLANTRQIPSK